MFSCEIAVTLFLLYVVFCLLAIARPSFLWTRSAIPAGRN